MTTLTTVVTAVLLAGGATVVLAESDQSMSVGEDAELPSGVVTLSSYFLSVNDTAACTREATGATVDIVPEADAGGFGFEISAGTTDPVDAHNACRNEHLDGTEIAYMLQVDNPVGAQFELDNTRLEACHLALRTKIEELSEKEAEAEMDACLAET
jgi:hypothetical protein